MKSQYFVSTILFLIFSGLRVFAAALEAPKSLTYVGSSVVLTRDMAMVQMRPSFLGGMPSEFTVTPALPAGVSLNPKNGILSGKPTLVTKAAKYIVKASNATGAATFAIAISVRDSAPKNLKYETKSIEFTKLLKIASLAPSSQGGAVVSYSVSPALPAGLLMNKYGVIYGTPMTVTKAAKYIVTASNATGTATAAISISVRDSAPKNLTYGTNTFKFTKLLTITSLAPSSQGGAVVSYSVSPALPAGLLMNKYGFIYGKPTAVANMTTYTITASNPAGSTVSKINIQVLDPLVNLNLALDAAFKAAFGRVPIAQERTYWLNYFTVHSNSLATMLDTIKNGNSSSAVCNIKATKSPTSSTPDQLRCIYWTDLNREPSAQDIQFYLNKNVSQPLTGIQNSIVNSPESKIRRMYTKHLQREPSSAEVNARLNEFGSWEGLERIRSRMRLSSGCKADCLTAMPTLVENCISNGSPRAINEALTENPTLPLCRNVKPTSEDQTIIDVGAKQRICVPRLWQVLRKSKYQAPFCFFSNSKSSSRGGL